MQEPSVLDFVKARLQDWRHKILHPSETAEVEHMDSQGWTEEHGNAVMSAAAMETVPPGTVTEVPVAAAERVSQLQWPLFVVLGLALWAQLSFEPRISAERAWQFGLILYILAGATLVLLRARHGWKLQAWAEYIPGISGESTFLRSALDFSICLVFALTAFIAFGSGRFSAFNVVLWLAAIFFVVRAFWRPHTGPVTWLRRVLSRPQWNFSFNRYNLLVVAVIGLVLFFRFYRLPDIPSQMISDHAEKLLDVGDVLNGDTHIFFRRNTGREFFQFYLTAGIARLFDTGLSYLSLKLGTVLSGLVTLIYMYLLGKEMGGKRVGLLAVIFCGMAYWHNIISRFGLRFPIYPLFYAPALYYLVWGLHRRNRLGFILSGLFLGLGLHGYSPFRVVPFMILVAIGLYLLHRQSEGYRRQAIWGLFMIVIASFIVFLPLLRYMTIDPDIVLYRAMTRIGDLEQPLPGPAWQIFLLNLRNALTMFAWDNGEIWPISVPHRPVLDVVTSVFFHLGVVLMVVRYIRQRHWFDIFTLISIPLLMMPSILSLSFPSENPSLNRTAAAIVPVFLVVALSFDGFLRALEAAASHSWNRRLAWAVGFFLVIWAGLQNYDLVFNQYRKLYDASSWNSSEMGALVRSFSELTGSADTTWVVGYPHWVDSRLVMINAGYPSRDNAIWPDNFSDTLEDPRPKLFMLNINDLPAAEALQSLYPNGWLTEYQSKYETKNFLLFFVPAQGSFDQ